MHPAMSNPPPFALCLRWRHRRCIGFGLATFERSGSRSSASHNAELKPLNRHIAATGVAANAPAGGVPVWATDVRSANV
jgi:hypothetical protein